MKHIIYIFVLFSFSPLFGQTNNTDLTGQEYFLTGEWKLRQKGDSEWTAGVNFPNSIHRILWDKKLIDNPYFGDYEKELKWIEEADWEAELDFESQNFEKYQCHEIVFESLEPYVRVYLNDSFLFESKNAFVQYKFDVSAILNKTTKINKLRLEMDSPVKRGKELQQKNKINLPGDERVYSRKPQYEYGWDWGPRFVKSGIKSWLSIVSHPDKHLTIENHHITTKNLSNEKAELQFDIEVNSTFATTYYLSITNGSDINYSKKQTLQKGLNKFTIPITIENPEIWWPNGMGKATSYRFSISFTTKKISDKNSELIADEVTHYAICDIKLLQDKDSIGASFYFSVNGKPVYLKGFNLIPESHISEFDNIIDNYSNLIIKLQEMNCNAIRIWGGGEYLPDEVMNDLQDAGILVWQDFMFAGGMYPGDSSFLKNVEEEITYQVKRLRNYNNIAVYCGNNEIDEAWHNWGWQKQYNYSKEDSTKIWNDYSKLFHDLIPSIVKKYDPDTDYIPTSPRYGWGRKESMTSGDSHYWGVWWGKEPIETFETKIPRFMSEFGMQAMPYMSTLEKVIPESKMNFSSDEFKNHQKHPTGFETLDFYLEKYLSKPENISDYAYATQVLQSITLQKAIEAQRLSIPKCMGTLIWQLNDTWPVTSWSVIDSEGNKKLATEYVERSFANELIIQKKNNGNFEYYFSDLNENSNNSLSGTIKIKKFTGETLLDTTLELNANGKIFEISSSDPLLKDSSSVYVQTIVQGKSINYYYLCHLNNLSLPDSVFSFDVKMENLKVATEAPSAKQFEIKKFFKVTVTAQCDVHYVHLNTKANYEETYGEKYPPAELIKGQTIEFLLPGNKYKYKADAINFIKNNLKCLNMIITK